MPSVDVCDHIYACACIDVIWMCVVCTCGTSAPRGHSPACCFSPQPAAVGTSSGCSAPTNTPPEMYHPITELDGASPGVNHSHEASTQVSGTQCSNLAECFNVLVSYLFSGFYDI